MKRKVLIVIAVMISIYVVFVMVDSIRLERASMNESKNPKKPFITLETIEYEIDPSTEITYRGLGYSVTYKKKIIYDQHTNKYRNEGICGAEFKLMDKFMLWAWIE